MGDDFRELIVEEIINTDVEKLNAIRRLSGELKTFFSSIPKLFIQDSSLFEKYLLSFKDVLANLNDREIKLFGDDQDPKEYGDISS